jgi:hypothetical protein
MKISIFSFLFFISLLVHAQVKVESVFLDNNQSLFYGYYHEDKFYTMSLDDTIYVFDFSSSNIPQSVKKYPFDLLGYGNFAVLEPNVLNFIGHEETQIKRVELGEPSVIESIEDHSNTYHTSGCVAHDGKFYFMEIGDQIGGVPAKVIRFDASETTPTLQQKTLTETILNPRHICNIGNTFFVAQFNNKIKKIEDITADPLVITEFHQASGDIYNMAIKSGKLYIETETQILRSPVSSASFSAYSNKTGNYTCLFSHNDELYGIKDKKIMKFIYPISVDEISKTNNIYPNPVVDIIRLEQPISQFTIFSISGKEILSQSNYESENIQVGNLTSGSYIINYTTKDGKKSISKFVKI